MIQTLDLNSASTKNVRVYETVEKMLACLLGSFEKNCKKCDDCEACSFLTQAVFTVGCKVRNQA